MSRNFFSLKNNYNKYQVATASNRTADNIVFASRMEMRRYLQLKLLEQAGGISELSLQPRFKIFPAYEKNGVKYRAIYYVADFLYYDPQVKKKVAEDVKGVETAEFKIKRKLFHYHHNMELRIVTKV